MIWVLCLCAPLQAYASSESVYQTTIHMAASGEVPKAVVALQAASAVLPQGDIWHERMSVAASLLNMQQTQEVLLSASETKNIYLNRATAYIKQHPKVEVQVIWPVTVLATLLPGAGHAWQGRWHDTFVAALFVWPMLFLTLWAMRRSMGPVSVFFALLTLWLWSGTVFSAISLAERGSFEMYMQWWQQLWMASALPGRPW